MVGDGSYKSARCKSARYKSRCEGLESRSYKLTSIGCIGIELPSQEKVGHERMDGAAIYQRIPDGSKEKKEKTQFLPSCRWEAPISVHSIHIGIPAAEVWREDHPPRG